MAKSNRNCELCNQEASIYCASDSAFLCWTCDEKVHGANFLVARHIRSSICSNCRNFDGFRFSGGGISPPARNLCRSCSPSFTGNLDCHAKVHRANFLVARHIRSSICSNYRNFDGYWFSGGGFSSPARNFCRSCSNRRNVDGNRFSGGGISSPARNILRSCSPSFTGNLECLTSSSSCVSSTVDGSEEVETTSFRREERSNSRIENVLENWCRRMTMDYTHRRHVVRMAVKLLGGCLDRLSALPFQVSLTVSFWVAMRLCGGVRSSTCQNLRRVEQISGVPGNLILATESRLVHVLIKHKRSSEDQEEGWAES